MHFALHFICKKQCTLHYIFICKKQCTLRYVLHAKIHKYWVIFLYEKKQCTLRYVFIFELYPIVMIPNYKRTYDQSDQIDKYLTSLLRICLIPTIYK